MKTVIHGARGAALFLLSTFMLIPGAHAVELGTASADPKSDSGSSTPDERETDSDKPTKSFAIVANPLGVFIGRYSLQAEWMPAKHHALVLNPNFNSVDAEVSVGIGDMEQKYTETFSGFGAELGYRFYTGSRMNGFYVGPSVLVGTYSATADSEVINRDVSFTSIGGAVDIGGQAVLDNGLVLGGGFGLQYTKVSEDFTDLPLAAAVLAGGGVRPRFLFSIGYAF